MLGSQEKFLEPKQSNRVSLPFPIWSIWPLLGQKKMFFGGLVKRGNQIWIVVWTISGFFFGPPELFSEVSEGFKKFNPEF